MPLHHCCAFMPKIHLTNSEYTYLAQTYICTGASFKRVPIKVPERSNRRCCLLLCPRRRPGEQILATKTCQVYTTHGIPGMVYTTHGVPGMVCTVPRITLGGNITTVACWYQSTKYSHILGQSDTVYLVLYVVCSTTSSQNLTNVWIQYSYINVSLHPPAPSGRKVEMRSSLHGPYELGYTRATMGRTICEGVIRANL